MLKVKSFKKQTNKLNDFWHDVYVLFFVFSVRQMAETNTTIETLTLILEIVVDPTEVSNQHSSSYLYVFRRLNLDQIKTWTAILHATVSAPIFYNGNQQSYWRWPNKKTWYLLTIRQGGVPYMRLANVFVHREEFSM